MKKLLILILLGFLSSQVFSNELDPEVIDEIALAECKQDVYRSFGELFLPTKEHLVGRTITTTLVFFDENRYPITVCIVTIINETGEVEYLSSRKR